MEHRWPWRLGSAVVTQVGDAVLSWGMCTASWVPGHWSRRKCTSHIWARASSTATPLHLHQGAPATTKGISSREADATKMTGVAHSLSHTLSFAARKQPHTKIQNRKKQTSVRARVQCKSKGWQAARPWAAGKQRGEKRTLPHLQWSCSPRWLFMGLSTCAQQQGEWAWCVCSLPPTRPDLRAQQGKCPRMQLERSQGWQWHCSLCTQLTWYSQVLFFVKVSRYYLNVTSLIIMFNWFD